MEWLGAALSRQLRSLRIFRGALIPRIVRALACDQVTVSGLVPEVSRQVDKLCRTVGGGWERTWPPRSLQDFSHASPNEKQGADSDGELVHRSNALVVS